ncbi:MAG: hypothetical protein H6541_10730 [Lentimicrobiaceae bacterium]|nr:hypothetical protein [Lentimicrobiaceae bacterium]MCB9023774.1 hypothetical protein [Lentimicrobiaceae bacterium]
MLIEAFIMQIKPFIRKSLIAALAVMLMLLTGSCSVERQLAAEFMKKKEPVAVLLLAPDFMYKYSYKIPPVDNFNQLPAEVQDSLLFFNSDLIQYLNDSSFFNAYINGLSRGLRQLGYTVYREASTGDFINNKSKAMIVNLAQLQLEEFYDSISDEASYSDEENYNYGLFITALNVNSWLELSHLNQNDTAKRVLYASETYTDYFDGGFRYFPLTGEVKYYYTIDTLTPDQVYYYASNTGYQYAGYLFDYLLNSYITQHMPDKSQPIQPYTYDRNSGMIRKSKGQGFIELK